MPASICYCLLDFIHSDRISHYGFIRISLMASDGWAFAHAFAHAFVSCLCFFFWELSIEVFCTFFNWIGCFFIIEFLRCWYILDISLLSNTWLANIFSSFAICLFIECYICNAKSSEAKAHLEVPHCFTFLLLLCFFLIYFSCPINTNAAASALCNCNNLTLNTVDVHLSVPEYISDQLSTSAFPYFSNFIMGNFPHKEKI